MSLLDDTKINMSLKKLVGKSHSTNDKDPANEADASYLITMADNVWVDDISTDTTAAVNAGVAEEIVAELDADITSNGKSYTLKYPVGHAKAGQRIYDSIPDSIHFNYEPLNNLAELKDTVVLLDQTEDNQKEKLVAVLNLETAKEHLRTVITDSTCYILNNKGTIIEKIVY